MIDSMDAIKKLPIVKEGVWLYEGVAPVRIRILSSPETWGTGDYEDDESISENHPIPCFFLYYTAAGSPDRFCNSIPNIMSLDSAIAYAEQIFPGIKWKET